MSTPNGSATLVVTFVDWPNIEKGLRNRFSGLGLPENVASLAVPAIGTIAGRLGLLDTPTSMRTGARSMLRWCLYSSGTTDFGTRWCHERPAAAIDATQLLLQT